MAVPMGGYYPPISQPANSEPRRRTESVLCSESVLFSQGFALLAGGQWTLPPFTLDKTRQGTARNRQVDDSMGIIKQEDIVAWQDRDGNISRCIIWQCSRCALFDAGKGPMGGYPPKGGD